MQFLFTLALSLLSFFTHIFALPPLLPLSLTSTTDLALPSPPLNASMDEMFCNNILGTGIPNDSCKNVYLKIPGSATATTWRKRDGMYTDDMPLPFRWLSDDGVCAVDLRLPKIAASSANVDFASIAEAAFEIYYGCVVKKDKGGYGFLPAIHAGKYIASMLQFCYLFAVNMGVSHWMCCDGALNKGTLPIIISR